jgi:predicted DNA-binding transcriptional regulator YafY
VLARLREALLAGRMVKFDYGNPPRWRKVVPYGLLFGPRAYLIARVKSRAVPVPFRLDAIHELEVLDEPGAPPPDFDLRAYAERSFGVFQEEPLEVVLRFAPSAAPDARAFVFHPTQTLSDEPDGSLMVRFRAGGVLEIAHHLLTWGPSVTIVAPKALEDRMRELVAAVHAHYCGSVSQPPIRLRKTPFSRPLSERCGLGSMSSFDRLEAAAIDAELPNFVRCKTLAPPNTDSDARPDGDQKG